MSRLSTALIGALAAVGIGFAVLAGPNLEAAAAAGAVAVAAAAFLAFGAWGAARPATDAPGAGRRPGRRSGIWAAFGSGPLGREDIIYTLDRLDRQMLSMARPPRSVAEVRALARVPPAEFRAYVTARLDELERVG